MGKLKASLAQNIIEIISETNGISLTDSIDLALESPKIKENKTIYKQFYEFKKLLAGFHQNEVDIQTLLGHPVAEGFYTFLKNFPIPYKEEHIHLTGSLTADFVHPRLKELLNSKNKDIYLKKIKETYGDDVQLETVDDIDELLRLGEYEQFDRYLKILLLPKLILTDRTAHQAAAFHMASELYHSYNVGFIRLKFTFSRATTNEEDKVPGTQEITEEDVVMGLFDGFMDFKRKVPAFNFVLSPCFRKEADFFDGDKFDSKRDHFNSQINKILSILERNPELENYLTDVDTVGNERELYRKAHFQDLKQGFRKLHYRGFSIRSHHGETWHTLKKGIQAVDNAMNIWHIDTLEHGLSLGINPNYYYHSLYQRIMEENRLGRPVLDRTKERNELDEMNWLDNEFIKDKLIKGEQLNSAEEKLFLKTKFHVAIQVEQYQHDVLNRMINKGIGLVALPSSNKRLTGSFKDYKDHPFSWWEKKGVNLAVGTDNYITLNTNYIQELLILLFTDPADLKITKLLMVATGETRRPYISHLLWLMRRRFCEE